MRKALLGLASLVMAAFVALVADAQGVHPGNIFIQALEEPGGGSVTAALPASPQAAPVVRALQAQTGDAGPIVVKAWRVRRFEQQVRCGRIAFALAQPSSGGIWPAIGGELNLCADGLPPLQVCAGDRTTLVPAGSRCRDNSPAQDTPEVAAAIRAALADGGLSREQVRDSLLRQHKAAVPSTAGATTGDKGAQP